jgi:glutamate-ammonia-ligase adenylyltransferase
VPVRKESGEELSGFKDPAAAQSTVSRIDEATHRSLAEFLLSAAEQASRPDQAIVNCERWITASGNPTTMADSLTATPELGRLLMTLFGASHQIADVLVQNPELASLVLDPAVLYERPDPKALEEQIASLLSTSTSFSHSLDRLRFVKQGWHIRIAAADLAGIWSEEEVWRALSDVADSLVANSREVVWQDVCRQRGYEGECPVGIVAMGKLGGQELNFSSDVDLVYVLADDAGTEVEKLASRFCEALNRALADKMGRGSLYRVDLRLRPYGSRGPLVPRMKSVEGYYERYAEAWEHLALVRSRVIVGDQDTTQRWNELRERTCFQPRRGEWFVQDLLRMRARIEEGHSQYDLKRGAGGIRDIEFLTQILQLLYGSKHPQIKTLSTIAALWTLARADVLPGGAAEDLRGAYTFLRQVEHRIQLLGDQQLHTVPADIEARSELARRTAFATLDAFDAALAMHQAHARDWYRTILHPPEEKLAARQEVQNRSGRHSAILTQWIDGVPESAAYYESLVENESSLERMLAIAERAPALVPQLRQYVAVTEQVMSGEVLEPKETRFSVREDDVPGLAAAMKQDWLRTVCRWALGEDIQLGRALADHYDAALEQVMKRAPFRAIALGSFGAREMSLYSDLDLVFWQDGPLRHERDEKAAQDVLSRVQALKRAGAQIELDLRLRPEGKKGRLVHTEESFCRYEASSMEPWERLALGRARSNDGLPEALARAAFASPLDAERLDKLVRIKRRVEAERVPVQYRRRHIKLGSGGQDDVLWMVQILWWRHHAEIETEAVSVVDRLRNLLKIGAVNAVESDQIGQAWRFYGRLRIHLALQGFNDEVLPENPDKLGRLGAVSGIGKENDVLAMYERHTRAVRGLYEATIERLRA